MKPQMHTDGHRLEKNEEEMNELTHRIIGCAYQVLNELGCGFLEKVYENAMAHELRKAGLAVVQQQDLDVRYDGVVVGKYAADLVVDNAVLIELKAAKAFDKNHMAQCINYLKATGLPICLLLNFGKPTLDLKRIVL